MPEEPSETSVVVVGAGFAGVACAKELAKHDVKVTIIDRHNYQQFQPLLYQVATAELATLRVYGPNPGLVGRCAGCSDVMVRLVRTPDAAWLDFSGLATLRIPLPEDGPVETG